MIVHCGEELKNIPNRVQSDLIMAIGERKVRGLDIHSNFDIFISFYGSQASDATAGFNEKGQFIEINTLPLIQKEGKDYQRAEVADAMYYFDVVRDFYGIKDERMILNTINKPKVSLSRFEKSLKDEGIFEKYLEFLKQRGRTYESYQKITLNNAKRMRGILRRTISLIEKKIQKDGIPSLRHELDHIDFFSSKLHKDYESLINASSELRRRLEIKGDKSISKEYASVNMNLLAKMSEVLPLSETRALFFNHSKMVQSEKPDFEVQGKKVCNSFFDYVNFFYPESILDKIVSQYWSERKMNRSTSNYLFWVVNKMTLSPNTERYNNDFMSNEINFDVSNQILHKDLPSWKHRFATNGQRAAKAYAKAFEENPKRLNEAKKAESFEKALRICIGNETMP